MNKRIKTLIDKASITSTGYFDGRGNITQTFFDKEKFANLLIQECADLCERFGESGDGYTCSAEILEHFGVE